MCGIIGYIGKNNFIPIAKQGLLNLEYRGYDSAGISYFVKDKGIETIKNVGNVNSLFNNISDNIISHCGIGHTRWATHGVPSLHNCHPHCSQKRNIYVVHNGIIENYKQVKDEYLNTIKFYSQTDTEVIPNLIEHFLDKGIDTLSAIYSTIKVLKGSFALAIINNTEPEKIYFAKNSSPLLIGLGKNENFISSDQLGFDNKAKEFIIVNDNSYGFITNNQVQMFNNGVQISPKIEKIQKSMFSNSRENFPYYMLKEIYDIPLAIQATCSLYQHDDNPLTQIKQSYLKDMNEIVIIACGTSYHSGLIGAKYFKNIANIKSRCVVASEFIYQKEIINKQTLCIFISQSGETADTLTAIQKAQQLGAKTIGITNVLTSSITRICDYVLPICAGTEVAVASTKAYNAQLVVLLLFASFLGNNLKLSKALIQKLLEQSHTLKIDNINNNIKSIVTLIQNSSNIYLVGRDFDYVTCLEASLKLKEITYIPCEAYPAGELKHGTLALISNETPVIAIITQQALIDKTMTIVNQVKSRGGKVIIFTNQILKDTDTTDCVVHNIESLDCELMSPIFSIIPFQLLAYQVTLSLGYNPDRPRNLAKSVTVE